MGKFNLSDAAKAILTEGSKETFDANIAAKRGQRGGESTKPLVGQDKLSTSVAYGQHDAGKVGDAPEEHDEHNPDYTKGTPHATPPGATPPVGSQPAHKLPHQPGQDAAAEHNVVQEPATDYSSIRDRVKAKLAKQTMQPNPGAHFQAYGEDMDALFAGEQLSEDFKSKASTIFEAAVIAKAEQVAEAVESELVEQFDAAVEQIKEELAQKLDDYISYMAEEWIKENQIAIEKGLRAEIVEDFMAGLRDLFVEHYIDIPEDKVNVVEELTDKVTELQDELNEQIQAAVELKKQLDESKKNEAIHAVCEGLTQTQVEKMKQLAEGVEFTTDEEFADKLVTLRESYFQSDVKVADSSALNEEVIVEEDNKPAANIDPTIAAIARTISQTKK
jgi:hypothetical protein